MRPWLSIAAAALMLLAACSPFGGTASASPHPSPVVTPRPSPLAIPTPSPTPSPSPTPKPSPPPTSLAVYILSVDYGFIYAQTVAGSVCNARAIVPPGKDAAGISNPKGTDANGYVTWNYPTPPVETGTGQAFVSCSHNGLSGTTNAYFATGNN